MTQAGKVIAVTDTPLDRADIALLRDGIMYYRSNDADENKSAVDALCDQAIAALDLKDRLAAATARAEAAEKDAVRWNMLPAFLEKYQINYVGLKSDIDAAQGSKP